VFKELKTISIAVAAAISKNIVHFFLNNMFITEIPATKIIKRRTTNIIGENPKISFFTN
jgi:hypothetical protein